MTWQKGRNVQLAGLLFLGRRGSKSVIIKPLMGAIQARGNLIKCGFKCPRSRNVTRMPILIRFLQCPEASRAWENVANSYDDVGLLIEVIGKERAGVFRSCIIRSAIFESKRVMNPRVQEGQQESKRVV